MNLGCETETIEFKKSTSELKEGVASIAAMLNKHGHGILYFGVDRCGNVIGQDVAESTLRKISQAIGNFIEPAIHPSIEALRDDDGRQYIKVSFSGSEKPYSCAGRYRIRVADEDLTASREDLAEMILQSRAGDVSWDEWASSRPIADVDEDELKSFVERGNKCGRINMSYENAEKTLERLALLRDGKLTNAAEVLFCPSRKIELKMGILASHTRTEILDLHQEQGTLFQLVRRAELYILNNTRRRFVIEGGGPREEIPELPREAVREIMFNAFTHRDWMSRACVQVDIFNDAVEVFSPGWFIEGQDPEEHLSGASASSLTRNPLISATLYKSKDIESYGTGIPRVRDELTRAGIAFEYVRMADGTKFVFHRNDAFVDNADGNDGFNKELSISEDGANWRESAGVDEARQDMSGYVRICQDMSGLSANESEAVEFICANGAATSSVLAAHLGVSQRTAARILSALSGKGILEARGTTRNRTYHIAEVKSQE